MAHPGVLGQLLPVTAGASAGGRGGESVNLPAKRGFEAAVDAGAAPKRAAVGGAAAGRFKDVDDFGAATDYVLSLIHAPTLTPERADAVMHDVVDAWAAHVNPGFLQYRKSVADDFAAVEWRDNADDPHGSTLVSAHGDVYIDVLGGFGIYNVGHSHPDVLAAVRAQLAKAPLNSQELLDPLRAYCAALLARTMPGRLKFSFFTNSGNESVDHALKLAILATGRRHFIGLTGAFHGKGVGALSATSKAVFRKPFVNVLLPFTHVPPNDVPALERAFEAATFTGNEIAGLILEPVLGEGGIHVLTDEYMRAARRLCDEHGAKLIFDEVQSGMGRCGRHLWACQHSGVAPDVMAIGKAFGGGVAAAGAVVATPEVWERYIAEPFLITTTFGGNPTAMAAAIATLGVLHKEGLPAQAEAKGDYTLARLRALQAKYPTLIREVRGRGLMIGIEFADNETGYDFARGAFARKVVISGTLVNAKTIRVEPPLTISYEQLDTVLARFDDALAEMAAARGVAPVVVAAAPPAVPSAAAATTTDSWLASSLDASVHISSSRGKMPPPTATAAAAAAASPAHHAAGRPRIVPHAHHYGGGGGGTGGVPAAAGIAAPPPLFSHGTTTSTGGSSAAGSPKSTAGNGGGYRGHARTASASSGGLSPLARPKAAPPALVVSAVPTVAVGSPSLAPVAAGGGGVAAPLTPMSPAGGDHDNDGYAAGLLAAGGSGGGAFKLDAAGGGSGDAASGGAMATTPSGDSPGGGAAATTAGPARPASATAFVA